MVTKRLVWIKLLIERLGYMAGKIEGDANMKQSVYFLSMLLVIGLNGCATEPADDNNAELIAAAIANPSRTAADRERDARDKPEVTLSLLDLQPGQAVVDLFGGGGYYSELMAGVVGEQGVVVLHNNDGYAKWVEKYLQERYIDNTVPPISVLRSEVADLQLPPATFDAAVMVMSYHDLYYYNPERGFDAIDVAGFFAQLRTALKPGGKLLLIDHSAPDGSGKTLTQEIHRIDEAFAREDLESNGFRLIATSDALRHPEDPRTATVFAKDIRGKTDRFVMVFQKQ
jgi:predicted methyltransferase